MIGNAQCIPLEETESVDLLADESPQSTPNIKKCPGCKSNVLAKILLQQGSGGWNSVVSHLEKCRRVQRLSEPDYQKLLDCLQLARGQCSALADIKAAARVKRRAEQKKAEAKAKVPYFAALAKCKPVAEEQPRVCMSCSTCSAEFRACDQATLTRVFEEHSVACAARCERQAKHHETVCEVTSQNALRAQQRVQQLEKTADKAKAVLKAKQEAVEQEKRRKRMQQGRTQKNLKKHVYSVAENPPEDDSQLECTIQGCMQRLRAAEAELKAAKQRAKFRAETAEICAAAAEGEQHKSVSSRAAANQASKQVKRQLAYRKQHKKMSKENQAIEKTVKSKKKGERRSKADDKMKRAAFD